MNFEAGKPGEAFKGCYPEVAPSLSQELVAAFLSSEGAELSV